MRSGHPGCSHVHGINVGGPSRRVGTPRPDSFLRGVHTETFSVFVESFGLLGHSFCHRAGLLSDVLWYRVSRRPPVPPATPPSGTNAELPPSRKGCEASPVTSRFPSQRLHSSLPAPSTASAPNDDSCHCVNCETPMLVTRFDFITSL